MKTRLSWVLSGMLCLLALGVQASSVYDDCVWFFNGGTDGFGGKAVDQVVQQGEIADELHRATAAHANHQALPQGLAMSFTREKVPLHAQGVGTQEVSCAKLNHTYSVVPGEGGTATTNFGFSTLKMPFLGDYCTNGNYSAIFRIRRDAANPFRETSWFMNFGYTGDNGFLLGFGSNGAISFHANNRAATTGGGALHRRPRGTVGRARRGRQRECDLVLRGLPGKRHVGQMERLYLVQNFHVHGVEGYGQDDSEGLHDAFFLYLHGWSGE